MGTFNLNPSQQAAVNHLEGPLLILAGAGSGKTRVIIERSKRLLLNKVKPQRILCLTFTRKAAREMKERIKQIRLPDELGDLDLNRLNTSTFHAFSLIFLKHYADHWKNFPVSKRFSICDQSDQHEALISVIKELNLMEKLELSEVKESISQAKNNLQTPTDIQMPQLREIWIRYQKFLYNRKMVDYDDLLFLTYRLLEECPEIRERIQNRFDYLMVDEYQDTNLAQYKIMQLILNSRQNLMVVGDDDQSIYSWRGAKLENILNFEHDFPKATTIKLEENYRSTQHIVNGASGLIKSNQKRKSKQCYSSNPMGKPLLAQELADPSEEGEQITKWINTIMVQNNLGQVSNEAPRGRIHYGHFAVLYRTKQQSRPIQEAFIHQKIPYRVWGELSFFDRKEIKDILAFIKLVVNPDDDLAFLRIINKPRRFREKTISELHKVANLEEISLFATLEKVLDEHRYDGKKNFNILNQVEIQKGEVFTSFFRNYHSIHSNQPAASEFSDDELAIPGLVESPTTNMDSTELNEPSTRRKSTFDLADTLVDQLKELLTKLEFINFINQSNEQQEVKARRIKNISRFYDFLENYEKDRKKKSFGSFINYLLLSSTDEEENATPMVNLLTIHSSKGLEFPYVFIVGVEENILPFNRDQSINEEEERRLLYVGITRAQKECYLSLCQSRKQFGQTVENPPSKFLDQIPDQHIVRNYGKFVKNKNANRQHDSSEEVKKQIQQNAFSKLQSILKED